MIPPIGALPSIGPAGSAPAASGVSAAGGGDFGNVIANALDNVQSVQNTASTQAAQAAAGQGNIADAMIATTEASVETQVTTAVTNKAVDAFNSIMDMSI
jgi:flagellar hook-basal body complex protein FliE